MNASPKREGTRGRLGITLTEVMAVVVIVGILAAAAVPQFRSFTGQNQLDGDANALYQGILWTRTQSIKSGKHYRVVFGTTAVDGKNRLSWGAHEVDAAGAILNPAKRTGVVGVSVVRGKLAGSLYSSDKIASGSASAAVVSAVSGLGTIDANGMQAGISASKVCSNTNNTALENWADGVEFCGGMVGDLETGGIHLYSTRSSGRAYAIVFDRNKSLQPKLLRWMGGKWEVL